MSGTASMYLRDAMVRQVFRGESLITTTWLALCLRVPEINGDGTTIEEPVGGAYARVQVPLGTGYWSLTGYNEVYNTSAVVFPTAGNYWGLIAGWAMVTAATGGELLAVGAMKNPLRVDLGYIPSVKAGGLVIGLFD